MKITDRGLGQIRPEVPEHSGQGAPDHAIMKPSLRASRRLSSLPPSTTRAYPYLDFFFATTLSFLNPVPFNSTSPSHPLRRRLSFSSPSFHLNRHHETRTQLQHLREQLRGRGGSTSLPKQAQEEAVPKVSSPSPSSCSSGPTLTQLFSFLVAPRHSSCENCPWSSPRRKHVCGADCGLSFFPHRPSSQSQVVRTTLR